MLFNILLSKIHPVQLGTLEKKFNRPLGKCKYISTLSEDCVILDQPVEFNLNL